MQESWVSLQCPACEEDWEETVSSLPESDATFQCDHCDNRAPTAEFLQTTRDLEILRSFHE